MSTFLGGCPRRHLRPQNSEQGSDHFALEEQRRVEGVGVSLDKKGGYWQATLVTEDRPLFFATIAGLLAALSHHAAISVGCYCADEARCHRSVLRELLADRGARFAGDE